MSASTSFLSLSTELLDLVYGSLSDGKQELFRYSSSEPFTVITDAQRSWRSTNKRWKDISDKHLKNSLKATFIVNEPEDLTLTSGTTVEEVKQKKINTTRVLQVETTRKREDVFGRQVMLNSTIASLGLLVMFMNQDPNFMPDLEAVVVLTKDEPSFGTRQEKALASIRTRYGDVLKEASEMAACRPGLGIHFVPGHSSGAPPYLDLASPLSTSLSIYIPVSDIRKALSARSQDISVDWYITDSPSSDDSNDTTAERLLEIFSHMPKGTSTVHVRGGQRNLVGILSAYTDDFKVFLEGRGIDYTLTIDRSSDVTKRVDQRLAI